METEELTNINISPLVTIPFATEWSPDNQISLITEDGIHILELEPCPMSLKATFKFARSFVYPSNILPAYTFVNEINSLVWKLGREDAYSLLMEEAITPKLKGLSDANVRILKLAWSPKNLISPNQCVLGILTSVGAVELLHKVSNEWYSICDVSSLRLNIVQDEIKSTLRKCKTGNNQYAMITKSMRQLQACSITWSELITLKRPFAYLSVAYRNGDILIWKVPRISNLIDCLQLVLVGTIDLNIAVKINVLCWISINMDEHLLIIGYFDGRICGVKLKNSDNNLQITSIDKYFEPDHIAISYLHKISQDKSNIKILASKGCFLLLLCINQTGVLQNMRHMQVEGFNITGITPIADQQFLITTQDNRTFVIDIQTDDLISVDIKSHLPQKHVQCLGLAHSPNKIMFVNIVSPNTLYDHLVTREPSTASIFTLKGSNWNPLSIINQSGHLGNVWDCMEVLRLKAIKSDDPRTILHAFPGKPESLSFLQISVWISVMIDVREKKKSFPNMDHIRVTKASQVLQLIFIQSTCTYLDNLIEKTKLSKDQELSVNLLRKCLKMYLVDNNNNKSIRKRVQETLKASASYPSQIEKCSLCDETINEFTCDISTCPSGHKSPRCNITLLQISSLEYHVCPICKQLFHPCLEEVYEEPRCLFCDVPILHNIYAFDVQESKLYGRNLSQLQVYETESLEEQNLKESSSKKQDLKESLSREQDSEGLLSKEQDSTESSSKKQNLEESCTEEERQKKVERNTSRICPVIANSENDEPGEITEKWEFQ